MKTRGNVGMRRAERAGEAGRTARQDSAGLHRPKGGSVADGHGFRNSTENSENQISKYRQDT